MLGSLALNDCPVCRDATTRSLHPVDQEYELRRCTRCGLLFAAPRPDARTLERFYGRAYFDERGWLGSVHGDSAYLRECWAGIRGPLAERLPVKGRLLDVGCATGTMLLEAKTDGWDCDGLEVSDAAASRA